MSGDENDIAAALKHLGFDSVADLHYWAKNDNELNRFDALVELLAAHRLAAIRAIAEHLEKSK